KWAASLDSETLPSEESEELILKKFEIRHSDIWIFAEYGGKNYFSIIKTFSDPEFFDLLCQKLSNSIGQTIREIGDFELEEYVVVSKASKKIVTYSEIVAYLTFTPGLIY